MNMVPAYLISLAVQAIQTFCQKYGVTFDLNAAILVTLAFGRGKKYEWTPCEAPIRRIIFEALKREGQPRTFVVVYGYHGIDQALTDELNACITQATSSRWG